MDRERRSTLPSGITEGAIVRSAMIRIVAADESIIIQEGLATLLGAEPDMTVVSTVCTGAEAIHHSRAHRPNLITTDLLLPDMAASEFVAQIKCGSSNVRIVAISSGHPHRLVRVLAPV